VLGAVGSVVGVDMHRVLVLCEQREPGVVDFGDGASRPVLDDLTDLEVFKKSPVCHWINLTHPFAFRWRIAPGLVALPDR